MNYHYTIEIEVTNYCNASCVFCANNRLKRKKGFIDVHKLYDFLKKHKNQLADNFFKKEGMKEYPRVTLCGLGDPLLHPNIVEIVKNAHNLGYYTQLVTNGYLLSPELMSRLGDSGLDEIAISLHSLNGINYYQTTKLPLDVVKENIKNCASIIKGKNIKLSIWRIYHPNPQFRDVDDSKDYFEFLKKCKLEGTTILGPSEPWYRDGVVPGSLCDEVQDKPFWCNKILFTFNIDWQGNVILCCNDYNRETVILGNAFSDGFSIQDIIELEKSIVRKEYVPEICLYCKRWQDTEIFDILNAYNKDENIVFDSLNRQLL